MNSSTSGFSSTAGADERIVRRLKRNMQWGYTFDEIADVYLDLVRTRHDMYVEPSRWKADLVINGSGCTDNALAVLASYHRTQLDKRKSDASETKASDFLCLYGFSATTRRVNFPHCLEKTKHSAPPVKATANQSGSYCPSRRIRKTPPFRKPKRRCRYKYRR